MACQIWSQSKRVVFGRCMMSNCQGLIYNETGMEEGIDDGL